MMKPIWSPSPERIVCAEITAFIAEVNRRWAREISNYAELHRFSVEEPELFWLMVWDFCGIVAEHRGETVLTDAGRMPGARWFPDARLNFARNLLRRRDNSPAVIALREDGIRRELSFAELYAMVSRITKAMRAAGIGPGDRVAAYMPNIPEAVAAMLATASIGAIWSTCAPEFGIEAAVDRIGQITPKMLLTADGYLYGDCAFSLLNKAEEIVRRVPSIRQVVVVAELAELPSLDMLDHAETFDEFIAPFPAGEIEFAELPFNHPVLILFSSGTTGAPKCIVHGAGGVLLENLKSMALQFDVKRDDRVYWWTTTGWVVWNLMIFALGRGASIVLYDGSPFHPTPEAILRHAAEERATFIRLTPKYVSELAKAGVTPGDTLDLSALRTMIVSSSPFGSEGYDFIYGKVKRDLHLGSPAGGTDPLGSLVSANPIGAVWPGEIQGPALGFSIAIFDEAGRPLDGAAGELVVTRPFPSMPIRFWNDPDDRSYRNAYFNHFPNVWRHGDWARFTDRGGVVIFGRSDATLKVRGIRIGTAEIYRQLSEMPELAEQVAVEQNFQGETRIVLFVTLKEGIAFDESLIAEIRRRLRDNLSPRHVPEKILAVPEIPLTITGKVSEIAVRDMVNGRPVENRDTLANPTALCHFLPEALQALSK
jgi:acetoacetyl-CoA synthetase